MDDRTVRTGLPATFRRLAAVWLAGCAAIAGAHEDFGLFEKLHDIVL